MNNHDDVLFEDWDTDYTQLSNEILSKLVLGDDLFVATSALSEIRRRDSALARDLSVKILLDSAGDAYLQACATSSLIPLYLSDLYSYILKNVDQLDFYIINTIISDMSDEVAVIDKEDEVNKKLITMLCEIIRVSQQNLDKDVSRVFLRYYCGK